MNFFPSLPLYRKQKFEVNGLADARLLVWSVAPAPFKTRAGHRTWKNTLSHLPVTGEKVPFSLTARTECLGLEGARRSRKDPSSAEELSESTCPSSAGSSGPPGEGWRAASQRLAGFLFPSPQLSKHRGEHAGGGPEGGSGVEPASGIAGTSQSPWGGGAPRPPALRPPPPDTFMFPVQRVQNLVSQQPETLFLRI